MTPKSFLADRTFSRVGEHESGEDFWMKLPKDVVIDVVARLPFQSYFRLQNVCKKWRRFVRYLRLPGALAQAPMVIMVPKDETAKREFAACDPTFSQWHVALFSWLASASKHQVTENRYPIAAGGGLVVLELFDSDRAQFHFMVSNPVTKCRTALPPLDYISDGCEILGIFVDKYLGTYRIPFLGTKPVDREHMILREFHSEKGSWQVTKLGFKAFKHGAFSATYFEAMLFFLALDLMDEASPVAARGYNVYYVREGVMRLLEVDMPQGLFFSCLHHHHGRLILVGGVSTSSYEFVSGAVYVWELNWVKMRWVEVHRAPDAIVSQFAVHSQFKIVPDGDYILVTCSQGQMAMFSLHKQSWSWLPRCNVLVRFVEPWGLRGYTYPLEEPTPESSHIYLLDPRLDVPV